MTNLNPIIGLYLSPFINSNPKSKFNMLNQNNYIWYINDPNEINVIKKNNINQFILSYSLNKRTIKRYINSFDGLYISGNTPGTLYTKELKQQLNSLKYMLKIIEEIQTYRVFPIYGQCHGYELLIKAIENVEYDTDLIYSNYDAVNYKTSSSKFLVSTYSCDKKISLEMKQALPPDNFYLTSNLQKDYQIISIAKDRNNKEFVDIIRHKYLPIYLSKSFLINNKILLNEFLNYILESNQSRIAKTVKKKNEKIKLEKLKYRTFKYTNFLNKNQRREYTKNITCRLYKI